VGWEKSVLLTGEEVWCMKKKRSVFRRVVRWVRNVVLGLLGASVLAVVALKFVPVYYTPLMFIRMYEQKKEGVKVRLEHRWTPLERIAQPLVQAVVASEDNRFLTHSGFDFEQIEKARDEAKAGKRLRGASTISQQTAKNVFLWPGKTYVRKGLEAYFTLLIEWIWGKERIMEVYLNSIEMGKGIYGAEAAAEAHFGKKASQLSRGEAALIAAALPNPLRYSPANPSAYMRRRQAQIMSLMNKINTIEMGCK
jgi:monofunctional biosynthetic peptidoglycan transglycosylase